LKPFIFEKKPNSNQIQIKDEEDSDGVSSRLPFRSAPQSNVPLTIFAPKVASSIGESREAKVAQGGQETGIQSPTCNSRNNRHQNTPSTDASHSLPPSLIPPQNVVALEVGTSQKSTRETDEEVVTRSLPEKVQSLLNDVIDKFHELESQNEIGNSTIGTMRLQLLQEILAKLNELIGMEHALASKVLLNSLQFIIRS